MDENWIETLTEVISEVLETSAFVFGEPCQKDDIPVDVAGALKATIVFEGPLGGSIEIAAAPGLATELAAGVLGLEADEVTPEQAEDALKELVNVTCGQWLTSVFGDEPIFKLTASQLQSLDESAWSALVDHDAARGLLVDEAPLLATLAVESEVAT